MKEIQLPQAEFILQWSVIYDNGEYYYEDVNENFCKIFGHDIEYYKNKNFKEVHNPDVYKDVVSVYEEAKQKKTSVSIIQVPLKKTPLSLLLLMFTRRLSFEKDKIRFNCLGIDITKEKGVTEFLPHGKVKFKDIYSQNPDGVTIVNKDGYIVDCNDVYLRLTGYEKYEVVGRHITDFFSEEYKHIFYEKIQGLMEKGFTEGEIELVRKDGRKIFVLRKGRAVYDENGNFLFIVTYDRDITDIKIVQKEIREKEREYETLFENAGDAILIMKEDRFIKCNKKTLEMFGCKKEDIIGETPYRFSPEYQPDGTLSKESALKRINDALSGVPQHFYWKHKKLNGSLFDAEVTLNKVEIGEEIFLQAIVRDITEKRSINEELRKLYRAVNQSSSIVVITDLDGKIEYANPAFTEITGYDFEEVKGKDPSILKSGYHPPEFYSRLWQIVEGGNKWTGTFVNKKKNGELYWEKATISPVFNEKGEITHYIKVAEDISREKKLEELIIEEKNKYLHLIENSLVGIFVLQGFVVKFCNKKLLEILGYDKLEDVIGKSIKDLLPPAEWERITKENIIENFRNNESRNFIVQIVRKDGTLIDVEVRGGRIYYESRPAFQGTVLDVTDKKRIERRISLISEINNIVARSFIEFKDYKLTAEKILEVLNKVVDFDHGEIFVSIKGEFISVVRNNSFPQNFMDIIEERFKKEKPDRAVWLETLKKKKSVFVENMRKNPLTEYFYDLVEQFDLNQIYSVPLYTRGKIIGGIQCITKGKKVLSEDDREIIDIVAKEISAGLESIIIENFLRERERLYEMLLNNISQGIYLLKGRHYEYVNPAFCKITGYSFEELTSPEFNIDRLFTEETKKFIDERFKARRNKKDIPSHYQIKIVTKDGNIKDLEVDTVLISDGEEIQVLGFIKDITEELKTRKELQKLEKLESIGLLAGGIAHDFNNVLMGIVGNLSLAKMHLKPDDKLYEIISDAEQVAFSAKSLTNQLLTFSKGGAPVKKIIDIKHFLKQWVSFALRGSPIKPDFSIDENLYNVEVDPGQISQVVNNLVFNARDAMPEGGVLEVGAENFLIEKSHSLPLKPGKYVKISIRDHGVGIPAKYLDRIFDPFFTTKQKGSGLGLAVSFSIVKQHGGHITVYSELGKGTVFHLYLPAAEDVMLDEEFEKEETFAGGGRILIMDDQEIVVKVLSNMLKKLGFEVEVSYTGEEAVNKYKKYFDSGKVFDFVILDLTVPGGMGGKEAVKKILEINPDAKVIVSSGYSNDPIMSNYKEYGFSGMIVKPYTMDSLKRALRL